MIPGWLTISILLAPLAAAVATLLVPRSRPAAAHAIGALVMASCTALALCLAAQVVPHGLTVQGPHTTWLDLGGFVLGVGTFVDPMGAIMAVIVCLLATLVLIYNAWYMHDDKLAARFPWQFCLFVFAMLSVVLADNLFMSFVGWELVGLGSYLLIGFWFAKPAVADDADYQRMKGAGARGILEDRLSPAHAQLKAFVMNRIGDAGFLIGIGALIAAGSLAGGIREPLTWSNLALLTQQGGLPGTFLGLSGQDLLTLAALGIFCGAIGKSAQFPLHTWLPDAMQGPTTASSIIHAATMVAAGVFLVARCYPLFTPDALAVVGWIGGITCLLAASIACVQWDLKAVLAYSTVSQLGLMFVALGAGTEAGGSSAGISHLFTHALFKNLLFLCAGSVIHACAGNQDLQRMGGLAKRMPITAIGSGLAVLAIIGAPLFSGFFSKDAVIAAALMHAEESGGAAWGPFLLACAGSLLTATYMVRWWIRIFAGHERDHEVCHHAHDPSWYASAVLIVLMPFTCMFLWSGWLGHALGAPHSEAHAHAHHVAMMVASGLLVGGAGIAIVAFWLKPAFAETLARTLRPLHTAAGELWGIDRLWNLVFVRGLGAGLGRVTALLDLGSRDRLASLEGAAPYRFRDSLSLDGLIDGVGRVCGQIGRAGALLHDGRLGLYLGVAAIIAAAALLLGVLW
jgi:NADH-quinone oxidoreductase subunit L